MKVGIFLFSFCQQPGYLPRQSLVALAAVNNLGGLLRVTDTGEAGPANVGSIGEVLHEILRLAKLLQKCRVANTLLERRGGNGRSHCVILCCVVLCRVVSRTKV